MSEDAIKMPVDVACILHLLPHRYPFLLVDRVVELEPHQRIRALKNVTFNEPFFQGHFPGRPVMPGVLVIEAMAQAGGLLTQLSQPKGNGTEAKIGTPFIKGAKVEATVLRPLVRAKKVIILKYRRRKNSQRRNGHRQNYTEVQISKIHA